MLFELMNGYNTKALFQLEQSDEIHVSNLKLMGCLPITSDIDNFGDWLKHRMPVRYRKGQTAFMKKYGLDKDVCKFFEITHGVSVSDRYWIRKAESLVLWDYVDPLASAVNERLAQISLSGNLSEFDIRQKGVNYADFSTDGTFNKCWVRDPETSKLRLLKGSNGEQNYPRAPYSEVLASQIFEFMDAGIPYRLEKINGMVFSSCEIFTSEYCHYAAFKDMYPDDVTLEDILGVYDSWGVGDVFRDILVTDAITFNTDRHRRNHGFTHYGRLHETFDVAPGFDYNLSMLYDLSDEELYDDAKILQVKPHLGEDFISTAKSVMIPEIRNRLIALRKKGVKFELPFTDEFFSESRVKRLQQIVECQIDNILQDRTPTYQVTN